MTKFTLVSHVLPPSWSGQAVMIYQLLKDLNPIDYCLISHQAYGADSDQESCSGRLPGRYHYLPAEFQIRRVGQRSFGALHRPLNNAIRGLNILLGLLLRARQIARIVRRENCRAVVACTGDLLDLPAGYLASRLTGALFYPYLFDYYSYQWVNSLQRFFAQRIEPIVLKGAEGIIVPNEYLGNEYRRRYGANCTVIRNPCELSEYDSVASDTSPSSTDEIKIVYTGAVYAAQYDAFRNLVAAIGLLGRPNIKLHLYTAQSPQDLNEHRIQGPIVYHDHQEVSAMPHIQRQADILFLPLAFDSPYPEVIRTSAPGKMGEYLAAGRPILVHAPPDSFVVWYFRQHDCGLVVDQSDPAKLAQAIDWVLTDASLQHRLGVHARERAQSDFNILAIQSTFAELMKLDVPHRS